MIDGVAILSRDREDRLVERLDALGFRVQVLNPDKIEPVTGRSVGLIYAVPYTLTQAPSWPELRVRLSRISRFYVVIGGLLGTREIVDLARDGAQDVVVTGDSRERWKEALGNAVAAQRKWWKLYGGASIDGGDRTGLIGKSALMSTLRRSIQRIGATAANVLVLGESGTGKEKVSEAIHAASGREKFLALNCAALPADLLESELFGAERGAFTGALRTKIGLVEEAAGGTLLLDEIGEMALTLQPKLLRFLETRRARRVGATREYLCDVRVIAATNRDLRGEVEEGVFRADLFYRLGEVLIHVPPLRDRTEDIAELSEFFMREAAKRHGKNFLSIEPGLIQRFQQHSWPGNVRELKQVIERLAIHFDGAVMRESWWTVPPGSGGVQKTTLSQPDQNQPSPQPIGPLSKGEKFRLARKLLAESEGDLAWTAARLGIHPTTLYRWRRDGKV